MQNTAEKGPSLSFICCLPLAHLRVQPIAELRFEALAQRLKRKPSKIIKLSHNKGDNQQLKAYALALDRFKARKQGAGGGSVANSEMIYDGLIFSCNAFRLSGDAEQGGDKGGLRGHLSPGNGLHLPFAHPCHRFVPRQRPPRRVEALKAQPGADQPPGAAQPFDPAMMLLDNVIINLPRIYLTTGERAATLRVWKHGTFAALAGRRRRRCGDARGS